MNDSKKKKSLKIQANPNPLESVKDIGGSSVRSIKEDLIKKIPEDAIRQLFGGPISQEYKGDIEVGESLDFNELFTGRYEDNKKLKGQLKLERQLRKEERIRVEKRTNELRIQIKGLQQEMLAIAKSTQEISEEVEIAAMQAPVEPGVYHVIFFEKLLEFLKSFRKKIEEASTWLHASNKRAEKKNYWARFKKHGGKFLLAADHYLTRSAG